MRLISINRVEAVFAPFIDERLGELAGWTAEALGALGLERTGTLRVEVRLFLYPSA